MARKEANPDQYERRTSGARPMRGVAARKSAKLYTMRDLRNSPIS